MKKTIVAVSALAFALGVFADTTPVGWFAATPGSLDSGTWNTEPTIDSSKWVIDTDDDVYATYTPKTLEKAERTRHVGLNVAFGAAYAADDLPTAVTDAQAGLVLGIDAGVTNFYGLTSSGWTKLSGGVPADLDTELAVTVTVDYAVSPVTVQYNVGGSVLKSGEVSTFERKSATATSLSTVNFTGSGKVASIAGEVDYYMVAVSAATPTGVKTVTIKTGDTVVTTGSVIEGAQVTATYTTEAGYFINHGTEYTTPAATATAGTPLEITLDKDVVEGVANYNSTRYETVQSAVSAAAGYSDAVVEVVLSANESVTIPSNTGIILTTKTNDTVAVFSGSIAAADNAENATLLFKQGYYNFGTGYDYGAYCATGFWPETTGVENVYLICPGEPVLPATETMPAQNLPPGYWDERGMTGLSEEKKQAYLEEVPAVSVGETSNGQPRWVNEALGISATTPVPVEAPQTADSTVTVYLDGVIPSSGLTAQYVVNYSDPTADATINLNECDTGSFPITVQLKDANGKAATVTNVNFGVIKRAEQKAFDMVPVAFANMDGTPVTVANVVKTANLTKGDQMHVLNSAKTGYDNFVLEVGSDNVKYWTKQQSASTRTLYGAQAENTTDPENYTLSKGQAVWLERQDTNATIITYGAADMTAYTQTLAQGMNLVANPCVETVKLADVIKNATLGDQIIINDKYYECYDDGEAYKWHGFNTYVYDYTKSGKPIKAIEIIYLNELTAGQGFWYNAKGTSTEINWPDLSGEIPE